MLFGLWIFLFMIDNAGRKSNPETLGSIITQPMNGRKKMEKGKKKWIDDSTLLASIDLKRCLLINVLKQQVISIFEGSVAFWGPMITKNESNMLERCLKTGLHIIYQDQYVKFSNALKLANMKSLKIG